MKTDDLETKIQITDLKSRDFVVLIKLLILITQVKVWFPKIYC